MFFKFFCGTVMHFFMIQLLKRKKLHLFKIDIFCNIISLYCQLIYLICPHWLHFLTDPQVLNGGVLTNAYTFIITFKFYVEKIFHQKWKILTLFIHQLQKGLNSTIKVVHQAHKTDWNQCWWALGILTSLSVFCCVYVSKVAMFDLNGDIF